MINKNEPEPPVDQRACYRCGRKKGLKGRLIHWPSEDFKKEIVIINGSEIEAFSMWNYSCQWCRAAETRRKNRWKREEALVK